MAPENRTKRDIFEALLFLAHEKPLDSLSVKEICEHAHVSRQTLYAHFADKYDVTTWFVLDYLRGTMRGLGTEYGWREAYRRVFSFVENNASVFALLTESEDRNSITETTLRTSRDDFTYSYMRRYGEEPGDLIAFQIRHFALLTCTIPSEWAKGGCPWGVEGFLERFITLVPRDLYEALDVAD